MYLYCNLLCTCNNYYVSAKNREQTKPTENLPMGSALGPDWASDREMKGASKVPERFQLLH